MNCLSVFLSVSCLFLPPSVSISSPHCLISPFFHLSLFHYMANTRIHMQDLSFRVLRSQKEKERMLLEHSMKQQATEKDRQKEATQLAEEKHRLMLRRVEEIQARETKRRLKVNNGSRKLSQLCSWFNIPSGKVSVGQLVSIIIMLVIWQNASSHIWPIMYLRK